MPLSRRKLPLNALRAFEATGRHCHMRQAAEELGVTHAAISRQIRLLEESLGTRLFDRAHNRLSLTSAGQRLLTAVSDSFDRIAETTLYLDPETMSGPLVWASTPSATTTWLIDIIGTFQRKYPEVESRLVMIEPNAREIPRDVDVAICYGEPGQAHLQTEEIYREQFFPACSPELLHRDKPIQRPEDLALYPFISDRLDRWPRWYQSLNLPMPKPASHFRVVHAYQAIDAAKKGLGVVMADRLETAQEISQGNLIRLFRHTMPAEQAIYLAYPQPPKLTLRTRLFIDWLKESLAELV